MAQSRFYARTRRSRLPDKGSERGPFDKRPMPPRKGEERGPFDKRPTAEPRRERNNEARRRTPRYSRAVTGKDRELLAKAKRAVGAQSRQADTPATESYHRSRLSRLTERAADGTVAGGYRTQLTRFLSDARKGKVRDAWLERYSDPIGERRIKGRPRRPGRGDPPSYRPLYRRRRSERPKTKT